MVKEFGEFVEEDIPPQEFGEFVDEGEPSFLQQLAKAPQAVRSAIQTGREAIKGAIKKGGVGAAEALLGTYGDIIESIRPSEAPSRIIRFPTSPEVENLMQTLGIETEPQNIGERFAKIGGEAVGTGLAFGGGALGALATGAVAGQTAREFGAPEWLSSIIDIGATFGKGAFAKKLLPKTKEAQKLVTAGRKLGFAEKELAPLVKSEKTFAIGKAFTRKGAKMQKLRESIDEKFGDSYQFIKKEAAGKGRVPFKDAKNLDKTLRAQLKQISKTHSPTDAEKKAMEILDETIRAIHLRGTTYEKLIHTYQSINKQPKAVRNLLTPLNKAFVSEIRKKSPELATDFENVNQLYTRFANRIGKMNPNQWDELIDKMTAWGIPIGIGEAMVGKPGILMSVLSKIGVRSLAQAFLTQPWLQDLPNKFIHSLKVNNKEGAIKLVASFKKLVKKKYDKDLDEEEDY